VNKFFAGAYPKHLNDPGFYRNKKFIFIDISGFTPMCDKFIRESSYGAEKIGEMVNHIFNPVIDKVYELGGDVVSFAGDAIFTVLPLHSVHVLKKAAEELISSQNVYENLSIKIEELQEGFLPQIINSAKGGAFCFYPSEPDKSHLERDQFPYEIYQIRKERFSGELRAVPIFFIHIDGKFDFRRVRSVLNSILENADRYSVYLNKIEFIDKGWMILLSAGSPVYSADAPVKMYEFLTSVIKKAREKKIPVSSGGTLQRGYCGIIGNDKRWEFTFLGSNVNLAARIAVKADPYGIFVDSSFAEASKTNLKTRYAGSEEFKGIGNREIFEVTGAVKEKKNVFVGREDEIRSVLNFFSGDRRAFVLLDGPSGIGKTFLAEKLISDLGYKNLYKFRAVYGDETDNCLFRSLNPAGRTDPGEIFQAFKAINQPSIFFIDDVQYADPKSLFLLHRMMNEGNPFVNFIVAAIGRDKIKINDLSYYETMIIDLKPFGAKDIQTITRIVSGIDISLKASREIEKTTKGNPLFISGILPYIKKEMKGEDKIPYSIQEVVLLKLNGLPGKGADFVDGGAVYGDIFDEKVVRNVSGIKKEIYPKIIQKAENDGILRRSLSEDEVEFQNTIIRETVYERLLKKKIDFFRIKIAESILSSGTNDLKKLYKAFNLFHASEDERTLKLAYDIAVKFFRKGENGILEAILLKAFKFILDTGQYGWAIGFIELFAKSDFLYIGGVVSDLSEQAALKIKYWKGKEKLILWLARVVFHVRSRVPSELIGLYASIKGKDKYYHWTRLKTHTYVISSEEGLKNFDSLKNSFRGTERADFYMDYIWFIFMMTGDRAIEDRIMPELNKLTHIMKGRRRVEYLLLINTIAIHRDDMELSRKCLEEIWSFPFLTALDRYGLLNDFSILYSNLAYEYNDGRYIRKSLACSIRSHSILKDIQRESDLPLITTNLASFYISLGMMKKAERYLLEGLYFGQNINHPVEVPYTKSRIAFLTSASGAYKLSSDIADQVLASDVGDIKSAAYTMRFLYGSKDPDDLKQAKKVSKDIEKFGSGKCWWEMFGVLISHAFTENDILLMKKIRKQLVPLMRLQQRQSVRFGNEGLIEMLGVMTGVKEDIPKLKERIGKLEKLGVNFTLRSKSLYALGLFEKDPELLKLAKKYALKMKHYPFVKRIETELLRITGDRYWAGRIKISDKKLETMNKVGTIEEFLMPSNKK